MKITCSRDELAARLGVVSRGLSTRGTGADPRRRAAAGDRTAASSWPRPTWSSRCARSSTRRWRVSGSAVVPGRLLTDIVRLLPEEEVVARASRRREHRLRVTSGSSESRLRTYAVEDFPRLPDPAQAALSTLDAEPLLETIARVSRAASRDESRPVLTGHPRPLRGGEPGHGRDRLLPHGGQGDGGHRRAARARRDHPGTRARRAPPDRCRRRARSSSATLENHVVFGVDDVWLTTRRIDGQFPNYKQLLPGGVRARGQAPARGVPRRRFAAPA